MIPAFYQNIFDMQAGELYKICSIMGIPTQQMWPEGIKLASAMNFRFHIFTPLGTQADELYKICSIMGTPTQQTWPEGIKLASAMNFRFPTFTTTPLSKIVTNASPEAIDLITSLCSWDPNKRPSAVQVCNDVACVCVSPIL